MISSYSDACKSLSGEEIARELISVLSVTYSIAPNYVLAAMRDRASTNTVALRTMKVTYHDLVDIGCYSHTIDRVGEHFNLPNLSEFITAWISSFSHSPKTTDPNKKALLEIELAAVVDWGAPFVKATYALEGDGALAVECYEIVHTVRAAIHAAHTPNVQAIARKLVGSIPALQQQLVWSLAYSISRHNLPLACDLLLQLGSPQPT